MNNTSKHCALPHKDIHVTMYPTPWDLGNCTWSREDTSTSIPKVIFYPISKGKNIFSTIQTCPLKYILTQCLNMLFQLGGFEQSIHVLGVRVHRVLPKDQTPRITASHKQITDQYTNVCHVVKTLERETIHGPGQIATRSNLLCKRKKVT